MWKESYCEQTLDDLANLAIALEARELKSDIRVVMRMFDGELAKKVEKSFGIHAAFSTSALAAPAFAAAATQAQITHSFYIDGELLNVSEIRVQPASRLVGRSPEVTVTSESDRHLTRPDDLDRALTARLEILSLNSFCAKLKDTQQDVKGSSQP